VIQPFFPHECLRNLPLIPSLSARLHNPGSSLAIESGISPAGTRTYIVPEISTEGNQQKCAHHLIKKKLWDIHVSEDSHSRHWRIDL